MSRTYSDPPRYSDEELATYNRVRKELLIEDAKWALDDAINDMEEAIEDAGMTPIMIRNLTDYEALAQEYIDRDDSNFSPSYLWMMIAEEHLNDLLEWGPPSVEVNEYEKNIQ